jgi:hypothetical protein
VKKKAITMKLSLNKETLRNLSTGDLRVVVGGVTARCSNFCEPTGASDCYDCGVTTLSGGSCPSGMACC